VIARTTLAALALGIGWAPVATAQDIGIGVGATPTEARVEDLDGRPVVLGRYLGQKPAVVEFWATWCSTCEALLPRMLAARRRYGDQVEFLVVGVGVNQTLNTMRRHVERHPMPFRFFFDREGSAVRAFAAPATGYIVILDAAGRVAYTGAGPDQDIEGALRRLLPRTGS
jgi:thiol-disulfide isomerase/thioredoxin